MRKFVDEVVYPDAQVRWSLCFVLLVLNLSHLFRRGKKMASLQVRTSFRRWRKYFVFTSVPFHLPSPLLVLFSELGIHAMRLGPGKHLKGMKLMNGLVAPEQVTRLISVIDPCSLVIALARLFS
jgi:hypothetical protein